MPYNYEAAARRKKSKPQTCQRCGAIFQIPGTRLRKYCSAACYNEAKADNGKIIGQTKHCAKCGAYKSFAAFPKQPSGRAGLGTYCKDCANEMFRVMNGNTQGPSGRKKQSLMTAQELKDHLTAQRRAYRERNREYVRTQNKLRHLKNRAAGHAPDKYDLGRMLCSQDARCTYCADLLPRQTHLDHKMPVSRGGTNALPNLQLLCPTCNMRKGAMTHEEYARKLGLMG